MPKKTAKVAASKKAAAKKAPRKVSVSEARRIEIQKNQSETPSKVSDEILKYKGIAIKGSVRDITHLGRTYKEFSLVNGELHRIVPSEYAKHVK